MKRQLLILIITSFSLSTFAQSDDFKEFRKRSMESFQSFRKTVLDDYADYLAGVWERVETFRPEKRDDKPKPNTAPVKEDVPTVEPEPQFVVPEVEVPNVDIPNGKPVAPPTPALTKPMIPKVVARVNFPYYGTTINAPRLQCVALRDFEPQTVAKQWKEYQKGDMAKAAEDLKNIAMGLHLNDYMTMDMVCRCVNFQAPDKSRNSRLLLQHFLLASMGYDIRIADEGGKAILLVAFQQIVYGRCYLILDERTYWVFGEVGEAGDQQGGSLYTCKLPSDADHGKTLSLIISDEMLVTGDGTKSATLEYNGIKVTAEVDRTLMEIVRLYPQMDMIDYSHSVLQPEVRLSVLSQLKPHIEGKGEVEAVQTLLSFVQHAFEYATDYAQHGYEKPYFFEENFYYQKNDCEDRAMFFKYLVENLLRLDVKLIHYPGHECTAVHFSDNELRGAGCVYKGKKYTICDPTFVGASIGDCMPMYVNEKMQVDE